MITLSLEKIVTLSKEVKNGQCYMQSLKYKELAAAIAGVNEIEVNYRFGDLKRRVKQLTDMGYQLKETIWFNDDAPYARIREVWAK